MAGAACEIKVDTLTPTLRAAVEDANPQARRRLAKNLGVLGLAEHARYFEEERDPLGRPWKRLSVTTLKRRYARRGRGNARVFSWRILQSDGTLRASLSPAATRPGRIVDPARVEAPGWSTSARGAIRRATDSIVEFGTNVVYAAAHQLGLPRRDGIVRAHTRRVKSRDVSRTFVAGGGQRWRVKTAIGFAFVREHRTTLPAVPARPIVGLSQRLINQVLDTIRMTFWRSRGGTT